MHVEVVHVHFDNDFKIEIIINLEPFYNIFVCECCGKSGCDLLGLHHCILKLHATIQLDIALLK